MLRVFGLLAAVTSLVAAQCGEPIFKDDAVSLVEAGFSKSFRRGSVVYNYNSIDITYSPFLMVEDRNCIDESQLNLQVKAGNSDWVTVDSKPRSLGGGKYQWSIDAVPCKDHMVKFWVTGSGGSASLEYPEPISAVSEEEIIRSKYTPEAPTNLVAMNAGDNKLEVSWEASDCASSYEVSYGKDINSMQSVTVQASQGSAIFLDDLTSCSNYDITVYALVGDDLYSEDASVSFTTQPEVSSALQLEPRIDSDTNSVSASWQAFDKLSCVDRYAVSVCKEGFECQDEQEVEINPAYNSLEYNTDSLDQCSSYTLNIKPVYPDMELDPKIVEFRTKSPAAEGAENNLMPVHAEAREGQMIHVSWSPVQCAEHYEVYQLVNTGGDWEFVHKTIDNSAELAGVPCTEYKYGVSVTIDGVKSPIMEAGSAVMTKLDNTVAFQAPNLEISPTVTGVELSWDHGACIPSYNVRVCSVNDNPTCEESTVIRDSYTHNITHHIDNLHSCTEYTVEVLPQIEGQTFEPIRHPFTTDHPAPSPPAEFSADFREMENEVEFEWSQVECSSGYKLVQGPEEEVVWETEDSRQLFHKLRGIEPCSTYSYGIASVVGGELSSPTLMQTISVPPKFGILDRPSIEVLENMNDTVNLVFNKANSNAKCQIEYYQLRYSSLKSEDTKDHTIYPEDLEADNKIVLSFPGASGPGLKLEGRIKYLGHDVETAWIQSQNPQIMSNGIGSESSILVPIIIGILVGIVVLVIIVFFLVKKKRAQNKYDAEKASADKDETAKLNTDVPES